MLTNKNCWLIQMNYYNLFCMFSYDQPTLCKKKRTRKSWWVSHMNLYDLAYSFFFFFVQSSYTPAMIKNLLANCERNRTISFVHLRCKVTLGCRLYSFTEDSSLRVSTFVDGLQGSVQQSHQDCALAPPPWAPLWCSPLPAPPVLGPPHVFVV